MEVFGQGLSLMTFGRSNPIWFVADTAPLSSSKSRRSISSPWGERGLGQGSSLGWPVVGSGGLLYGASDGDQRGHIKVLNSLIITCYKLLHAVKTRTVDVCPLQTVAKKQSHSPKFLRFVKDWRRQGSYSTLSALCRKAECFI